MQPHEVLDTLLHQIEQDQASRYAAYREYAKLYGADPDMFGSDDSYLVWNEPLTQNELANTIQTLHAQVTKNKIVPAVATNEADYEEWTRARAFSRWIEGVFDEAKVQYDCTPKSVLDAFIYGTGAIKVGHEEDSDGTCTITFHRVDPRMVFVDRLEGRQGKPRNFYQKDFQDKYQLLDEYGSDDKSLYGSKEDRIQGLLNCKPNDDDDMAIGSTLKTNMVRVNEAWHLPTKRGRKDGRHVIWVKGCTLLDEPWSWDRFPFTFVRHGISLSGFWGQSAVRILAPTQRQFDKLNAKIDECQDIMAVPRIVLLNNAKITVEHVDDMPGGILRCDGPEGSLKDWNAQAATPELYNERAGAPDKMRSLLGITGFDVQSQLPPQLREVSGPALERLLDAGTARHALIHGEVEQAMVDLAYLAMLYAADLEEDGKSVTVVAPGKDKSSVEMLSFEDVVVDRKRMKLVVQPMSQLPQTFALKVEAFGKLRDQGAIDNKMYLKMLEVPDVQKATDFLGSDEEIILKNLHFMIAKGKYIAPLQYDNLDLIVSLTTSFINWYRLREDHDEELVGMLGQYIEDALRLKQGLGGPDPNAPPPMQPPMATPPPGPPVGAPLGPPGQPMAPMAPPGVPPPMMAPPGVPGPPMGPGVPIG